LKATYAFVLLPQFWIILFFLKIVSAQPSHASVIFGSSDATIHSNKQSNPLWRPPPHQHLKILGNNTSFTNQTLFAEEFQHTHNWIKNQCHLPRQAWNEKLASYTRRYEDCKLIHSNFNYNKNVFWTKFLQVIVSHFFSSIIRLIYHILDTYFHCCRKVTFVFYSGYEFWELPFCNVYLRMYSHNRKLCYPSLMLILIKNLFLKLKCYKKYQWTHSFVYSSNVTVFTRKAPKKLLWLRSSCRSFLHLVKHMLLQELLALGKTNA